MFGSFPPSPLVGLRLQSLLGPGSRHCYGIISLIHPDELVLRRLARFVGSFSTECRQITGKAIGMGSGRPSGQREARQIWVQLGCNKTSEGFLRALIQAIGAVVNQLPGKHRRHGRGLECESRTAQSEVRLFFTVPFPCRSHCVTSKTGYYVPSAAV
jgi:hypothetical protein